MAIEPGTAGNVGAIVFIALNVIAFWYREWRKHRTWRVNGDDLKEIKTKVEDIDEKVGETTVKIAEVQVAVNAQKEQCGKTVNRFDQAISDQGKELLKIAREK